ncbi:MAG: ABC transporter permease [Flavobacteriales bacterium]|nr:ABC transporter permease [Flavobacteriales bacterium]
MNLEYFIASNIMKGNSKSKKFTQPIIKISIAAIALSMIVMIISISIVSGFQREIRNKVIGFGGHIQITKYDSQNSFEGSPIEMNQPFYPGMDSVAGIKQIQIFATKPGIIKTNNDIYGVVVKGIGSDFDWTFFKDKLKKGEPLKIQKDVSTNEIVISQTIANKMKIDVDEKLFLYFIQSDGQLRPKDFVVKGIYQSGLEQFDNMFVITDISHIQKRNNWSSNQVGGFEVIIDDYSQLDRLAEFVYNHIGYELNSTTIIDRNPEIFHWLELQDLNVVIIILLMILVAVINIISALLILILERTSTIGILKILGLSNWRVRKVFLYNALHLILYGLTIGNIIGIGLCLIQLKFGVIKLPEESYYISEVPIEMSISTILLLNFGTLFICISMLIIPSYVITKISPVKAIRFD